MRKIRVRYLYYKNGERNITPAMFPIALSVPNRLTEIKALRNYLPKRSDGEMSKMWWESDSDEYEGNGLDDTVGILESTKPLVIAIPPFALHFRIYGRDQPTNLQIEVTNPHSQLEELYEEIKVQYHRATDKTLPPRPYAELNLEHGTWETNTYHLFNREDGIGLSKEKPIELNVPPERWYFKINGEHKTVKEIDPRKTLKDLLQQIPISPPLPADITVKFKVEKEDGREVPDDTCLGDFWKTDQGIGCSEEMPIFVSVYSFRIEIEDVMRSNLKDYVARGILIRNSEDQCLTDIFEYTNRFDRKDKNGFGTSTPSPFLVVENSSGTGKTQLAFCQDRPVLYTACTTEEIQSVYTPFKAVYLQLQKAFQADMNHKDVDTTSGAMTIQDSQAKLVTCGFLLKYFAILSDNQNVKDSVSLCGFQFSGESDKTHNQNQVGFDFSESSISELKQSYWRLQGRKPVLILDEIACDTKLAVFVRNVCRAAHVPVILMGTESSVSNFLSKQTGVSRGANYEYGKLITRMPALKLLKKEEDVLNNSKLNTDLKSMILASRPLCAVKMIDSLKEQDDASLCSEEIMTKLVDVVHKAIVRPKFLNNKESFREAHLMYLTVSSKLYGESVKELKKENGAGDKFAEKQSSLFLSHHFGQMQKAKALTLWRGGTTGSGETNFDACQWEKYGSMAFRSLKDDFFLHIALLKNTGEMLDEKSLHSVDLARWTEIDGNFGVKGQSHNVLSWRLEARVLAAACISSMCNGIKGVTLVEFLQGFLFHLDPTSTGESVEVDPSKLCLNKDIRGWKEKFPLLGLPMDKIDFWEGARHLLLSKSLGNVFIPSDQQRHDGRVIVDHEVILSFESKDKANNTIPFDIKTIESVLNANANTDAKLVLVVLNGRKANYVDNSIGIIESWCKKYNFLAVYAHRKENPNGKTVEFDELEKKTIQPNRAKPCSLSDETQTAAQCTGAHRTLLFVFLNDIF